MFYWWTGGGLCVGVVLCLASSSHFHNYETCTCSLVWMFASQRGGLDGHTTSGRVTSHTVLVHSTPMAPFLYKNLWHFVHRRTYVRFGVAWRTLHVLYVFHHTCRHTTCRRDVRQRRRPQYTAELTTIAQIVRQPYWRFCQSFQTGQRNCWNGSGESRSTNVRFYVVFSSIVLVVVDMYLVLAW